MPGIAGPGSERQRHRPLWGPRPELCFSPFGSCLLFQAEQRFAADLFQAASGLSGLRCLDLGGNRIGPNGVVQLAECLKFWPRLGPD